MYSYFRTGQSAEPWTFGENVLDISRNYINLRYRLLPYLYSVFYEATQDGLPVLRSQAIDYSYDPNIYDPAFQNQFLFGPSLLVMPQEGTAKFSKIYLPEGEWYDLYDDKKESGGIKKIIELSAARLPVYVKAGSIIPMQSLVQSTMDKPSDTLSLHIYNGGHGSSFELYEDDGETYHYEKGEFSKRLIRFDPSVKSIVLTKPEGSMASNFRFIRLSLHGFEQQNLQINGTSVSLNSDHVSFLTSSDNEFQQNGTPVKTAVLENIPGKIDIAF